MIPSKIEDTNQSTVKSGRGHKKELQRNMYELEGNNHVDYLDCGDAFMGVYIQYIWSHKCIKM
jgi:hypothetical protein